MLPDYAGTGRWSRRFARVPEPGQVRQPRPYRGRDWTLPVGVEGPGSRRWWLLEVDRPSRPEQRPMVA